VHEIQFFPNLLPAAHAACWKRYAPIDWEGER